MKLTVIGIDLTKLYVFAVMQILCRALGGRTGRSTKGWDIGVSCIHPTAAAARLFAPLKLPVHMPVIEFHQDEVWDLPANAEVLARSDKTRVEMFRLGDRVMGVQGHPEYSKDILMSIADRLLRHNQILVINHLRHHSCDR
jgi:GMP synthase-like glutamine amidotransferase